MKNKEYLSIKEASEILGVDRTTLRRWDKSGKLKPYRNPLNKYRQYKKVDVIKLAQETNKIPSDRIAFNINQYCSFFNKHITVLFQNYLSKEVYELISKRGNIQDTFLKLHYIKTFNLLISIFRLCSPAIGKTLPDEAKIISRSLFEHISNFLYIYSHDTADEINKLIIRFGDYGTYIAQHRYAIDYMKEINLYQSIEDDGIKLLTQKVTDYYDKYNIKENIEEYKNKHKTKNLTSWHGLKIGDFYKFIYENLNGGETFIFYKKFYTDSNAYIHCNLIDYINEEGIIVGNTHKEDTLQVVHYTILITLGYIELFYRLIDIDIQKVHPKIFNDFKTLCTNYYNFMGEFKTND